MCFPVFGLSTTTSVSVCGLKVRVSWTFSFLSVLSFCCTVDHFFSIFLSLSFFSRSVFVPFRPLLSWFSFNILLVNCIADMFLALHLFSFSLSQHIHYFYFLMPLSFCVPIEIGKCINNIQSFIKSESVLVWITFIFHYCLKPHFKLNVHTHSRPFYIMLIF